jgi:retron-type reverse transcriptase
MTVRDLPMHLKQHWTTIREQLLNGTYRPQPVKRVEIDKPDGSGVRKLGVPTVLDRFIQQIVLQVLQKRWDPTFSDHSYGFRPCLHYAQVGALVRRMGRKGMAKRVQRFASPTLTCTRACLETS